MCPKHMLIFLNPFFYKPTLRYRSVLDIPLEFFYHDDMKLVILDLDDTIAGRHHSDIDVPQEEWVRTIKHHCTVLLISNNPDPARVEHFANKLGLDYIYNSGKPHISDKLRKMIEHYDKEHICVIGDQLITDVILGNNIGCKSIYVSPLTKPRLLSLFFLRIIENILCRIMGIKFN